jgi:hypothetical protein
MVSRCQADPTLTRTTVEGFQFPLGTYPVEEVVPREGYASDFEPADGDDEADWEEWPDRYVYDIVVSAQRVEPLWRALCAVLPGRVYPILDYFGHDAFREIDPYISYEMVGLDRVMEAVSRCRDFFFEDGFVGFGAMSESPFAYVFVDEHKVVTVRVEPDLKARIDRVLEAFDLREIEEPAGADAAAHEHRGVLVAPEDRADLFTAEEIIENLREEWRLVLNVDPDTNLDDEGHEVGTCAWRCVVRAETEDEPTARYAEVFVVADCLSEAEELTREATEAAVPEVEGKWRELALVAADRMNAEQAEETAAELGQTGAANRNKLASLKKLRTTEVVALRWLE